MFRTTYPPWGRALVATPTLVLAVGCIAPAAVSPWPAAALPAAMIARDSAPAAAPTRPVGERILASADSLVGTRYRYGGASPRAGFDCSGLVRYVYARHGVELPRTARGMASAGKRVPADFATLRPGDLVFFGRSRARITHVAIVVGGGRILHASSGRRVVRYDDVDDPRAAWFRRNLVGARRVLATDTPSIASQGRRASSGAVATSRAP